MATEYCQKSQGRPTGIMLTGIGQLWASGEAKGLLSCAGAGVKGLGGLC